MVVLATRVGAVLLALAAVTGCYRPSLDACSIQCGAGSSCPGELHCNVALGVCEGSTSCAAGPDGGVPIGDFAQLGAGIATTCGLKHDGTLWCWGDDSLGQRGNGVGPSEPTGTPEQVGLLDEWIALSVGNDHACAVRTLGTPGVGELWCWGSNDNGRLGTGGSASGVPERVNAEDDWFAVAAGGGHTCGLRGTPGHGDLWCWGFGDGGQLGDDNLVDHETPTPAMAVAPAGIWVQVAAGMYHTCAIDDQARLYCWGYNAQYQVGNGNTTDVGVPTEIGAGRTWTQVATGESHGCALTSEGQAFCWGASDQGQGGDGGTATDGLVETPTAVVTDDRFQWIGAHTFTTCGVTMAGEAKCWGADGFGQLGDGKNRDRNVPVAVLGAPTSTRITVGKFHACALASGGGVSCWGHNDFGQLGRGVVGQRNAPIEVAFAGAVWEDIAAGARHTCGIRAGGELWCWGRNDRGQVGDTSDEPRRLPVRIAPELVFVKVFAGAHHSCAITDLGRLYCWGDNYLGELGVGDNQDRFEPTSVGTASWETLGLGEYGSAGIQTGGALYAWGGFWGVNDQPGLVVDATGAYQSVGGGNATCAVRTTGELDCWDPPPDPQAPDLMPGFGDTSMMWKQVAHGDRFACARTTGNEIWCAGENQNGQAATTNTPPTIDTLTALDLGAEDFVQVVTGRAYACGLRSGGTLTCWGENNSGQLGLGDINNTVPPTNVPGLSFGKVATGEHHTCAIGKDAPNLLYCWGSNANGQLGNGEGDDAHAAPVVAP